MTRLLPPRSFTLSFLALSVAVVTMVSSLEQRGGRPTKGLPPSARLADVFMTLLCRPPDNEETLLWDTKPFGDAELVAAVGATAEGARVRTFRKTFLEVLHRDPVERGCAELREAVNRPIEATDLARRLAATTEARRVRAVRQALTAASGNDPAGWDNASVRRWTETGFSLEEIESRIRDQRPMVGVYYFAWYQQDSRGWGNGVTVVPGDTPKPSLGWYSSRDEAVMDAQLAQMVDAGFDFVILQIVADSPESWDTAHKFFGRLASRPLKVVVMLDGLDGASTRREAFVGRVVAEFSAHPNYLWVRGSPLVLLFSAHMDRSPSGVTIRNVYWADSYRPDRNTFNTWGFLYPHDWPFWAPSPAPLINGLVPVAPGYSDTHLNRERVMEHARDDGRMYHEQWQLALALRPEWIVVYSWNEHFERTAIEPTEAWGDRYLRWTACYTAYAHAGRRGSCEQESPNVAAPAAAPAVRSMK